MAKARALQAWILANRVMLALDAGGVSGGVVVAYGFGLAWRPLGFIVGGVEILVVTALLLAAQLAEAAKAEKPAE